MGCGFFFFKQKTAYEMRISDWSSDVCSSDLLDQRCREQTDVETQRVVVGAETHRATEKRFVRRAVRGRSMLETGFAHLAADAGDPAPEAEPVGDARFVYRPHVLAVRHAGTPSEADRKSVG